FPVMVRARASFGSPRLIIPGGGGAVAAAQHRAARVIGKGRAGHIRLVLLLPRVARTVGARDLVDRMMEPGMPTRGHLGCFRLTIVDDPTLFATGPPAAAPQRLAAPFAVIAVAEAVGSDQFAPQPGQQTRAQRHRSIPPSLIAIYRTARGRA